LRLQAAAARLAELEYFAASDAGGAASVNARAATQGYDAEAKVQALWVWDLSQDLSTDSEADAPVRPRRAWRLLRALAEGTARLLAAAWRCSPANITATFVPLTGAALERPVRALCLFTVAGKQIRCAVQH
jgi:hypothetical protein